MAVLKQFPGIKDTDVAHILGVVCKSATSPASDASPFPHVDEAASLTPWNVRNLTAALKEVVRMSCQDKDVVCTSAAAR